MSEDMFLPRRALATAEKGNVTQTFSTFSFLWLCKLCLQHSAYASYHARPQQCRKEAVAKGEFGSRRLNQTKIEAIAWVKETDHQILCLLLWLSIFLLCSLFSWESY